MICRQKAFEENLDAQLKEYKLLKDQINSSGDKCKIERMIEKYIILEALLRRQDEDRAMIDIIKL